MTLANIVARMEPTGRREAPPDDRLREIRDSRDAGPGLRGVYHRARIRATRWLHPGYSRVICPSGCLANFVSSARTKNISLPRLVETALLIPSSRPTEGRIAIVTDAGWDAVDAAASGVKRDAGRV